MSDHCIIKGFSDVQVCCALGDGIVAMKYLRDELKLGCPNDLDIARIEAVQAALIKTANEEVRPTRRAKRDWRPRHVS